jgi:serine/threonine protein kinase
LTPEIEGKYEILEKIRVGGMGAIYKVRHRLLGDLRVIKVLRPQLSGDVAFQKRFHREARAATRLIHPNIARLYDFSVDETGAAYIVMEFIEGWTLDDLVSRGELPPIGLALEIARQGLRAIGHLHASDVIHRDISPDNLMLSRDVDGRPLVKLIDLGLVKSAAPSEELTGAGVFVGKFRYAAPEQFRRAGEPCVGPASDLYSFGLVFYELLTGRYPIVGGSASALIAGHLYHPPRDFAETDPEGRVPGDLRQVLSRLLAKEAAARFPSAEELAAVLEPIAGRYEVATPEAGDLLELTRQVRQVGGPAGGGSTQSRLDRQFGPGPTPPPDERVTASVWIARVESRIGEGDFGGARDELRRAREAGTDAPELAELENRIDEIESIATTRQVEKGLEDVAALRAGGRLEEALELARELRSQAPRHKLVQMVVFELGRELAGAPDAEAPDAGGPDARDDAADSGAEEVDEAAIATTTPFAVRYPPPTVSASTVSAPTVSAPTVPIDEAAIAPTEILPTVRGAGAPTAGPAADVRAQLETRRQPVPEPAPGAVAEAPADLPRRAFDEISLAISPALPEATVRTLQRRWDEIGETSVDDLPLSAVAGPRGRGPSGAGRSGARNLVTALVLILLFLLLGFVLAQLFPGSV